MSTNVGAVDFELLLNSNPFNKGLKSVSNNIKSSGIESMLGKIGKAAIAAFSVKAVVDFTKSCLELGSNLSEVQNVVDVTFGNLNEEVNKFAQNAITQFGLGQTVTKKYVGTFGAMAKAFDFNNQAALEMSKTLTGLTGDVASFYNMSSDEAFTKLKSVFTGETETLKDLGIVMTQTALDQYAMVNGFGKTTSAMTEQEKTALRYQFVLDKLGLAQGDFARTSDSWANQTRVLSLRFDELKASLGQGFINLFTPIVQGINWVLSKLQVLADAFKSFTEMVFGNASNDDSSISNIVNDATDASDAIGSIGDSAVESNKKLKSLASFDTAQVLSSNSDSSGSGTSSGTGIDFSGMTDFNTSSLTEANSQLDGLIQKTKELFDIFKEGFFISFGETNFDGILDHILNVKNALIDIWTDSDVINSAQQWGDTFLYSLGQVTGSISRIGTNIAELFLGSIDIYLEQYVDKIKSHICNMFDISSEDMALTGNLWQSLGEISDIFNGDTAKQIGADIIAMFSNPFMSVVELGSKFGVDLKSVLFQPIIDNTEKIKETFNNVLGPIKSVTGTLAEAFTYIGDKWNEVYDEHIHPLMESLKTGLSDTFGKFLDVYNEYIVPFLDNMATGIGTLWKEHLQPMVDSFFEFIGKLINGLSELWNTWLVPIINWIVENVVPILSPIFETIGNLFMNAFGVISDILNGIWQILSGLIDFIVGVFTGNWEQAWNGIKEIFSGIWTAISGFFQGIWNSIKDIVTGAIDTVKAYIEYVLNYISSIWNSIWTTISSVASSIWNGITNTISNVINTIKNNISNVLNAISTIWSNIWNGMKNTVTNIFNGIWNGIKGVINSILSGIESMVNGIIRGINWATGALNNLSFDVPDWVPGIGGGKFGFNIPQLSEVGLPRLAEGAFVKANTPQLAMIGDNKYHGEIVAPEDKLESIYRKVLKEQGYQNNDEIISLLKMIIELLKTIGIDFNLYIDGYELEKRLEKIRNKKKFARNGG